MARPRLNILGNTRKSFKPGPLLTRPPLDHMQQIFQKLKADRNPNRVKLVKLAKAIV